MYDVSQIKEGLIGLIGWRQNADSNGTQLTELLTSETSLFFNDVHPLLTFDNLESIAPRFGDYVADQTAINAGFTEWLTQKTESAIITAINNWIDSKFENRTAKNLLARESLFSNLLNLEDYDTNNDRLVGIEVVPKKSKSLVVKIKEIGLQLSENQSLEINLFESGTVTAIETINVNYTANGGVQWFETDWTLQGEKAYYVVYDQTDLSGQSINGVYDWGFEKNGLITFPTEKLYKATAFNSDADGAIMWNPNLTRHTLSTNYGINLNLDVRCDYTSFILDQKDIFKNLIWLQVGINLLRELAFNSNTRINRNEANIDYSQILYEIDGDSQGRNTNSLAGRYKSALDSIQFDETGIDSICLPCKKRGIRYKSIG